MAGPTPAGGSFDAATAKSLRPAGGSSPALTSHELPLVAYRGQRLLPGDIVLPHHVAPELDLALEQRGSGFGGFLVVGIFVHAAVGVGLAHLGIGERGA